MTRARYSRRGFALVEALAASVVIAVVLLALLEIRNNSIRWFTISGDQYTASWLAEMKMNEILAQKLPDPNDPDAVKEDSDSGDFGDFDARVNEFNRRYNEMWKDREYLRKFTFHWTKTLVYVGPEFTGTEEELAAWQPELDENGEPLTDDPRTKPAARLIRVTLEVTRPLARIETEEGDVETDEDFEKRSTLKLVTYVDPSALFAGKPSTTTPPAPPPTDGGKTG